MSLIDYDFSTVNAVIFNMDGTLFDNKDLAMRMILQDKFNFRKAKAEKIVRKKAREIDFENSDKFYDYLFKNAAKMSHTSVDKYRKWYFTVYMPNCCSILKNFYYKREGIEELFIQLRRNEIPFAIYSDYTFLKEKLNSIGMLNTESLLTFSAEEMGCLKPLKRGFKSIAESLLSKNFPSESILVVGDRIDMDYQGAKNAGLSFIQIENSKNVGTKLPEGVTRVNWGDFSTSFLSYLRQQIALNRV